MIENLGRKGYGCCVHWGGITFSLWVWCSWSYSQLTCRPGDWALICLQLPEVVVAGKWLTPPLLLLLKQRGYQANELQDCRGFSNCKVQEKKYQMHGLGFGPPLCICIAASSKRFLLHFSLQNPWDFFFSHPQKQCKKIGIPKQRGRGPSDPLDWQERGKIPTRRIFESMVGCWRIV